MPDPGTPELQSAEESFSDIFAQYEKANAKKKDAAEDRGRQIEATLTFLPPWLFSHLANRD